MQMKKLLRIDEMYAFIAVDPVDNTEGIIGMKPPGSDTFMPFVGADMMRIESLRPYAMDIAKASGGSVIRLVKFSTRETLEEIKP